MSAFRTPLDGVRLLSDNCLLRRHPFGPASHIMPLTRPNALAEFSTRNGLLDVQEAVHNKCIAVSTVTDCPMDWNRSVRSSNCACRYDVEDSVRTLVLELKRPVFALDEIGIREYN